MEFENRIDVTDRDGWRKEFVLNKRLIYIGSDNRNDVVLSPMRGTGVAPRHLQLVIAPAGIVTCSAVNLSAGDIPLGDTGQKALPPNSAVEVRDGQSFRLGDFMVVLHFQDNAQMGQGTGAREAFVRAGVKNSAAVGLRLVLQQVILSPDRPIEGMLYVSNLGNAPGVQFRLGLDGLPADCFEIGAAPILFPGAEKGVPLRIWHPMRSTVAAGTQRIALWADAVEAYPGEVVTQTRDLRILPFYSHTLRVLPNK
jgi:hypothetical protein